MLLAPQGSTLSANWRRRNPTGQTTLDRFQRPRRTVVVVPARSPGTMELDAAGEKQIAAPGTIRRLYLQTLAGVPGPPPVEWSRMPAEFTRGIRYKASTTYKAAGTKNTRLTMLHTQIRQVSRQPRPVFEAGVRRGRPTVRNRMQSFGSRVEPLNRRALAAQPEASS